MTFWASSGNCLRDCLVKQPNVFTYLLALADSLPVYQEMDLICFCNTSMIYILEDSWILLVVRAVHCLLRPYPWCIWRLSRAVCSRMCTEKTWNCYPKSFRIFINTSICAKPVLAKKKKKKRATNKLEFIGTRDNCHSFMSVFSPPQPVCAHWVSSGLCLTAASTSCGCSLFIPQIAALWNVLFLVL